MIAWRTWTRSQLVCRALIAVLPSLALIIAPARPNLAVTIVVVGGSLMWATSPELAAGPVVLLTVMAWWALVVPDPVQLRVLAAGSALSGAHVAALLAAYGPARGELDRGLVLVWVRRSLLAFVAAPVAYAAVVYLDAPDPRLWVLAMVVLALLVLVLGLQFRDESDPTST